MSKSVFGIATTHGQAERIVEQLQAQGFAASEISVLMPDTGGTRDVGHVKATKAPEGATTGAATGGATGGVIGLLAGIGALAIPGSVESLTLLHTVYETCIAIRRMRPLKIRL